MLFRVLQSNAKNEIGNLQTFVDIDGLVRLQIKLGFMNETNDFKAPIILPSSDIAVWRLELQHADCVSH